MKNTEHTPGPWTVSGWSVLEANAETVICNVLPWDTSGSRPEDIANANLLAASPDMLDALMKAKIVLELSAPSEPELDDVNAAINKALWGQQ